MKLPFPSIRPLAAVLIVSALSGCANMAGSQHSQRHPQSSTSQTPRSTSGGASGGQSGMMMMDKQAMCDMHEKMMSEKTPEEREAMMDERMRDMSPEMMQKHMQMIQEQCKR